MPNNTNQTTAGGFQTSDEMDPAWIGILEALILFVIMMVAVIGNFLVIAVVYRRRELRRTETHIFIVNLSLTDISVALLCMPFSMLTAVTQKWIFSDALCQLNGFLNVFFLLTSILTLTAISIHKYIGVVQPTKRKIFTRKRTIMAVIWVWLQALLTALTPIFGWNDYEHISGRTQCSVKVPRENKLSELTNCLFIIITGFVIPLGIMSFSYLKIFQTVQIHTKRVRSHSFGEEQSQSAFLNERRITITLFIILAVFLACWSPFSILTIYATLAGNELSKYFSVAAYWLGFLNSAMNPLIYALRTREFRQGYREILGIILPCCFAKIDSRDSDSIAVLRGRRSIKSEVMAYSKRHRAGTKTENYVSEAPVDVKNAAIKGKHRKDTLTVGLETKDESESVRYETASAFSIRSKEISEIQDSYYSAKRTTSVGEDNCVKIQDVALHHREVTEGAPLSSDSDVSLSLTRESLLLPWNSTNVLGEQTFPKNFEEDAKSRRKSLSFLSIFLEKPDLIKSRQLYRSKSDCSSAVQSPVGGHSCPNVDLRNPQSSNPWLRENLSYLDRISPIHLEDSCG